MKKDDIIELTIEDLGIDGEGIGKADGMAIFVKDAVVGDRIQALWLCPSHGSVGTVAGALCAPVQFCTPVRRLPAAGYDL